MTAQVSNKQFAKHTQQQLSLFDDINHTDHKNLIEQKRDTFTFIDLFAGIGGFHLALNAVGAKCVFAAEWDEFARKTYIENFSKIEPKLFEANAFAQDITTVDKKQIPDFDILCAGFPCQPFSQAGLKQGFDDVRGTLFFDIAEIIKIKQPQAFFLENVRGLLNHDEGKTFKTIQKIMTEDLGYSFYYQIVRASSHGLPQHRPRLFMIGFKDKTISFQPPTKKNLRFTMSDVLGGVAEKEIGFTLRVGGRGSDINDRRNWEHYKVDGQIKRIGSKEGLKMQGFPDNFILPVTETQAMKQLGNSVAVDAIRDYAQAMIEAMIKAKAI